MVKEKKIIRIGKVNENFGWLGNFGRRDFYVDGKNWKSFECYFISKRFDDEDIIEMLRMEDNGGMKVKMLSKKYLDKMVIERCGDEDVKNMEEVVNLKFEKFDWMRKGLLNLDKMYDLFIYEDILNRNKSKNNMFWGGYWDNGNFVGKNMLGEIIMNWIKQKI